MRHRIASVLLRLAVGLAVLSLNGLSLQPVWAQATLEDPQPGSFQSGIGLIRGWVCDANTITIEIDGVTFNAAYGTTRADTRSACGDDDNGFGLTFNWNLLGDGQHRVRALADGVVFGDVTFTVTTLGLGQFPLGLSGAYTLSNFPQTGKDTIVRWQESVQNFIIIGAGAGGGSGNGGSSPRVLEDPAPGSFQSGVGLIRGWVCEANTITIEIDGVPFHAAYGTTRADTRSACGDDDNGFGLTFNWNLLGDGQHRVRALADGVVFGDVTFTVTTLGLGPFPRGLSGEYTLEDFPQMGKNTKVRWQESIQNFVIVGVEEVSSTLPTGTYKGALEATTTDCEPEEDDDEFELSGSLTVKNNTGNAFSASGDLSIDRGGFTFTLDIDFAGTSTAPGNISGNYSTNFKGTNGFSSKGSGTFQGSITSTSLKLTINGKDTDIFGTTCILRGTFTGSR